MSALYVKSKWSQLGNFHAAIIFINFVQFNLFRMDVKNVPFAEKKSINQREIYLKVSL